MTAQVAAAEAELLLTGGAGWLDPTASRLAQLLNDRLVRSDLLDWLRLTQRQGQDGSTLSQAVRSWLLDNGHGDLENRADGVGRLIHLLDAPDKDHATARLAVVLGLQYFVLYHVPGLREFRGALIVSNLLGDRALSDLRHSLRVPRGHGSISWMTALQRTQTPERVVTIGDASLDLRGRVAAEDLVCGNRAVCGFALTQGPEDALIGYFFVSHPVAGLFGGDQDAFEDRFDHIRRLFSSSLAHAIEADLITRFGQETLERSATGAVAAGGRPEVLSLTATSPTGFLAALRTGSDRSGTDRSARRGVECDVSEQSFLTALWSQLQLSCYFSDEWADPVVRHLDRYAALIQRSHSAVAPMAWIPQYQYRPSSHQHEDASAIRDYYPPDALPALDALVSDAGMTWCEWHRQTLAAVSKEQRESTIQRRITAGLAIYSEPHPAYSDLVVPILAGSTGGDRVSAFLRINCAPPEGGARNATEKTRYRLLYDVMAAHLPTLGGIGRLLAWVDEELRLTLRGTTLPLARYKQLSDAARLLADWTTAHLAGVLSGRDPGDLPSLDVARHVFGHLAEDVERRKGVMKWVDEAESATRELAAGLTDAHGLPDMPVFTMWLQTSQPGMTPHASSETAMLTLARLVQSDPGLPQLLTYLSSIEAWRPGSLGRVLPLDLTKRCGVTFSSDGMAIHAAARWDHVTVDLGLTSAIRPPDYLRVSSVATSGHQQHVGIEWSHDGGTHAAKLEWEWPKDQAQQRQHPFHAALSLQPGKLSRRVGTVVAGRATFTPVASLAMGEPLEHGIVFSSQPADLQDRIRSLEHTMLGEDDAQGPGQGRWYAVSLPALGRAEGPEEWLLFLAAADPVPPVVRALRKMAVSYERNAEIARLAGERAATERTLDFVAGLVRHEVSRGLQDAELYALLLAQDGRALVASSPVQQPETDTHTQALFASLRLAGYICTAVDCLITRNPYAQSFVPTQLTDIVTMHARSRKPQRNVVFDGLDVLAGVDVDIRFLLIMIELSRNAVKHITEVPGLLSGVQPQIRIAIAAAAHGLWQFSVVSSPHEAGSADEMLTALGPRVASDAWKGLGLVRTLANQLGGRVEHSVRPFDRRTATVDDVRLGRYGVTASYLGPALCTAAGIP